MCTGNLPGGKGRPAGKADNFTAIYEPPEPVTGIALPYNPLYMNLESYPFSEARTVHTA
jgi:hypothetical protein